MAFWHSIDPDVRKAGKLNYDLNIEQHIAAEKKAAVHISLGIKEAMVELKQLKKYEKLYRKAIKRLEKGANKKLRIQQRYEAKIRSAQSKGSNFDVVRIAFYKRQMYRKMARVSVRTYKKLQKIIRKIAEMPELEKRFAQLNQEIEQELEALVSGIRKEAIEEEVEQRAAGGL